MDKTTYDAVVAQLQAASAAYYGDGSSVMSDAEFDDLLAQVRDFDATNGITDGIAEKVAVGAVTGDVAHSTPMLSLDNIFDTSVLRTWMGRADVTEWAIEPKLDGLAVAIQYESGKPVQMVTRGDGQHGENVTFAIGQIANLPTLAGAFSGEVRGEIIFTREQFDAANSARVAHGKPAFANARNGAAGALRGAKDRAYDMPMSFYAYDLTGSHVSHTESMHRLRVLGFEVAVDVTAGMSLIPLDRSLDAVEVAGVVTAMADPLVRGQMPVETDGLVIKANQPADRDRLGAGSRAPRWAVAFKFPAEQGTTKLIGWDMEVGRTGVLTPRAILNPVFVGGTTVTYATLHNFEDVARKDIRVGDTVVIVRAGEVIPRVEAAVLADRDGSETPIVAPTSCPRCGGPLDASQARLRCAAGRDCGVAEAISYAVGRDALDIEGLGKIQVSNLVASETFVDVASIFETGAVENLLVTGGNVAPANAPKIVAQVEKAKSAPLARVITALGIKGTGRSMSRRLAAHFGSMAALQGATVTELAAVDGVGDVKAELIRTELDVLANVITRLAAAGVVAAQDQPAAPATDAPASALPLAGKSVCVTGTMVSRSRNEMNEFVESLGAKASSSVSKNTNILLAGPGAGSKLAKAESLGVTVMSEDEFLAEFGSGS